MGYIKAYQKIKNKIKIMTFYDGVYSTRTDEQTYKAYEAAMRSGLGSTSEKSEADFLEDFNLSARPSEIGFMPPAVRYVNMASRVMVFESVPQVRKINVASVKKSNVNRDNTATYDIAVPWQLYIASFDIQMNLSELKIYFTEGPMESFDHQLFTVPLFNVYGNGQVCLPSHGVAHYKQKKDYCQLILAAIEDFWLSSFNTDLYDNLSSSNLDYLRKNNTNMINEIKLDRFDVYSLYKMLSAMSLEEVMEFKFVPYLKLNQVLDTRALSTASTTQIIQQLTLRNC